MPSKFLKRIVQAVIVAPVWLYLLNHTDGIAYRSELFNVITYLGIVFSALSILLPAKWAMGLNNYLTANIIEKISPLVFSIGLLLLMGRMTQTWTVVIVSTFFFANSICYIGYLIADITVIKVRKFLRRKG